MTDISLSRGGMCSNPFGGEDRIDRINLMEFLEANAPAEKVLYCSIIQDAASNYLYALLGKNGTSVEEFFAAHQYFFKVVSTDMVALSKSRLLKQSFTLKGEKVKQTRQLTDNELKLMCFDKHYEFSGLPDYIHIDKFREGLKERRRNILAKNWEQVQLYVTSLYKRELSCITDGNQVPLQVWTGDLLEILVDPPTPHHLANVLMVPSKLKRPTRPRAKRQLGTATRKSRDRFVDGQRFFELGANDVENAGNNGSGSLRSDSIGHSVAA